MYLYVQKALSPEKDRVNLPEDFLNHQHNKTENLDKDHNEEDKQRIIFMDEESLFKTELNTFKELTKRTSKRNGFHITKQIL